MRFVYCVDKNFNKQLLTSISSLLRNIDEKVNISILHDDPKSFLDHQKKLEKFPFCNQIEIIEVNTNGIIFPNLFNSHVSKATYFRIFIPKYITQKEYLIYLDADTVVLKNPLNIIKNEIKKLSENRNLISACLETDKESTLDIFERLSLKGNFYFNAGVILIDNKRLQEKDVTSELLLTMSKLNEKIKYWDQDILNKYFDTKFLILDERLNVRIDDKSPRLNPVSDAHIIHYAGSSKPWTLEGLLNTDSHYFQNNYLLANNKSLYFMTTKWKLGTLKLLIKKTIDLSIFNNKDNLKIIFSTIYLLFQAKGDRQS